MRRRVLSRLCWLVAALLWSSGTTRAQDVPVSDTTETGVLPQPAPGWQMLADEGGVQVAYHTPVRGADRSDGIVLRLVNQNGYPVLYRFEVVFRSEGRERVEVLHGHLVGNEVRSGEEDGLYWVPFPQDVTLTELGIEQVAVEPF